jgi:hypothetical protein
MKGTKKELKNLNKEPRSVGGQIARRTLNGLSEQTQSDGYPNHRPQCIAYYVTSEIKSGKKSGKNHKGSKET